MSRNLNLLLLSLLLSSCADVHQTPYVIANVGLTCTAITSKGELPLLDPVQMYSACEDKDGKLYFPNGMAVANNAFPELSGGLSAAIAQSGAIVAMLGGF